MNRQSTSATSVTRTVKPIATLTAAVPQGSRELFFGQLRAFSEVNKFQITISGNAQFKNVFDIEMIRDDVWVIGDSLFDPLSYRIETAVSPHKLPVLGACWMAHPEIPAFHLTFIQRHMSNKSSDY